MDKDIILQLIAYGVPAAATVFNVLYTNYRTKQKKLTEEEETERRQRDETRNEIAEHCRLMRSDIDSIKDDIDTLRTDIDNLGAELDKKLDERDAVASRHRVLRFGDECLHGKKHTEEHFKQILSDIDDYEAYCEEHKEFKNGKTKMTCERIRTVYEKCIETNDFL